MRQVILMLNKPHLLTSLALTLTVTLLTHAAHAQTDKKYDPRKWEKTIQKFEAADKKETPPTGATLFIGSSSIRGWDLKRFFPDLPAINRGFGGSHIEDSTFYAHRIVWPYKPKTIVLYAGDNDMAFGKSADTVVAHYKLFVKRVREKLPEARIVYVPIKPSLSRWNLWPKMRDANAKIKAVIDNDPKQAYAPTDAATLGDDGKPRKDFFLKDGLHLNAKGYAAWTKVVQAVLDKK